uniref:Insulin-like domain-containing protein n=1 Tax=Plectus sambesii TaxID=2011161 RepID=A0A914XJY7_9BILA
MDTRRTVITVVFLILLLSSPSFAAPKVCGQRLAKILNNVCSDSSSSEETPCFKTMNEDSSGLYKNCCLHDCTFDDLKKYCCFGK